jgi:adenosylcobinamide kinase/adenosylcobinamide-phosphate guanylyltransferase
MRARLTGSGSASGFPVLGCPCATCASAQRSRSPARLELAGGWWIGVDGVPCGPHGRIRLAPGETAELLGAGIRVEGRVDGVLLLLADGHHALWAPQAGLLADATIAALAGQELATVFLGPAPHATRSPVEVARSPVGDARSPVEDAPAPVGDTRAPVEDAGSLVDVAHSLARLRAVGTVGDATQVALVGLGHDQGPGEVLELKLAAWGAVAPDDGTDLMLEPSDGTAPVLEPDHGRDGTAGSARVRRRIGGRVLVLGGSGSGKSDLAEALLAAEPDVLYLATGPVPDRGPHGDVEWARRIDRHRVRRPTWWRTVETPDVARLLTATGQPMLLDSVGSWLTAVLDRVKAWDEAPGWRQALAAQTDTLVAAWRRQRAPSVAVSDEVGWSVVPATAAGRMFTAELGRLNRQLAAESEQVLVVIAGRVAGLVGTGFGGWYPGPP